MTIASDMETYKLMKSFALHKSAFASNKPYRPSKSLNMLDSLAITLSNVIADKDENTYVDESIKDILWQGD